MFIVCGHTFHADKGENQYGKSAHNGLTGRITRDVPVLFEQGDILPIEDYVRYIVLNYQHKFPDTELSKKLGISRKSLWEKRKKYGIIKKK
jgi:hypothetical protein